MADFKTRLKELRTAKGMSQEAIGELFILTQQSIYKYEHGLSEPDITMLKEMSKFFDVSVDYLIGNNDIPLHYEQISSDSITRSEKRLLEYYRRLSPKSKEALQILMDESKKTKSDQK